MSSGIAVDDECLNMFQDLKLRKKYCYIIYRLDDDNKSIIVEKAAKEGSYEDFAVELPETDCRYAVYDFEYQKSLDEGMRNKICFIFWAPDTAKVKQKMLYASSKDAIRKKLVGIQTEVQATDASEVSFEAVLEKKSVGHSTSDDEKILELIRECEYNRDTTKIATIIEEYRNKTSNRSITLICRAALNAYFTCSKPQDAYDFFRTITSHGYKPTIEDVETLIYGLLRHSDETKAIQLLEALPDYNLTPRTATYNLFIGFYLREHRPDEARSIFKKSEENGLVPNQTTYLQFLAYFIERADYKAADKVREYMRIKKVPVDIRFYNGMLSIMSRKRAFQETEALVNEMKQIGIEFNIITYDILLSSYASINDNEKIQYWLAQMRSSGIPATTKTFNKMLLSMSHLMSPDQTKAYLLEMSKQGLTFNHYTYTALILNLLKQEKYRETTEMIFELERKSISLSVESYGQLLNACCAKRLDPAVKLLWEQMQKNQIAPNSFILSILIRYFLMKREYTRVDAMLLQMKRKWGLKPNPFIFSILLNHSVETLDFARLKSILSLIRETNIEMNSVMYNVLMKTFYAYSRYQQGGYLTRLNSITSDNNESESDLMGPKFPVLISDQSPTDISRMQAQFERLFGLPFRPTIHIYNEILLSLLIRERFDEMKSCVIEMRKKDIALNITTFTFLIKARIFSGDIDGARETIGEMKYSGLKPSILHCALIFHAYCRKFLVSDAENFLVEMKTAYHLKPNHVFYGSLVYAYSRRKEYSRVFEIFERMEQNGFTPDTETCNYILISLLEINEFVEARKFFEKMLLQGIKRNNHTYSYLIMGFLTRGDDFNFLNLLSDCIMPGNIIDTLPFNRLLRHFYNIDNNEQILSVLLLMCDYCVQYDRDTAPYISLCIQNFLHDIDELPRLCRIMKKVMVDFSEDSMRNWSTLCDQIETALIDADLTDELESLRTIRERLPELRRLWTNINEETVESFSGQFYGTDDQSNLFLPLNNINEIKGQVSIMTTTGQGTREFLVKRLTGDEP